MLRLPAISAIHALEAKGIRFEITASYRRPEAQDQLVRQGHSYAPEGYSLHGIGMAMDIVPLGKDGRPDWAAKPQRWAEIREVMEAHGFRPIGSWDLPHYQAPLEGRVAVHLPELANGWKVLPESALPTEMKEANAAPLGRHHLRLLASAVSEEAAWPLTAPMVPDATKVARAPSLALKK